MIDEIDEKLIIELQKDGRASYASLSRKLGISIATIHRRIHHLLDEGIMRFTVSPEPAKMGYMASAIIAMNVEIGKIDDVCAKLAAFPNVSFTSITFGRFDVLFTALCHTSEELSKFIKSELANVDGVLDVETFIVAEWKKRLEDWHPPTSTK